jgi:hypothetical protein
VQHVTVHLVIAHQRRGDLQIELQRFFFLLCFVSFVCFFLYLLSCAISPGGMLTILAHPRGGDTSMSEKNCESCLLNNFFLLVLTGANLNHLFTTVAFWDENVNITIITTTTNTKTLVNNTKQSIANGQMEVEFA